MDYNTLIHLLGMLVFLWTGIFLTNAGIYAITFPLYSVRYQFTLLTEGV